MNNIRKIVDSNKGLVAFMLMLCFLVTGVAKGLVAKLPSGKEDGKKAYAKQMLSVESEDESSLGFLGQLLDGDADDIEFLFYQNYNSPNFLVSEIATGKQFSAFEPVSKGYAIPLYDLYCNWKFDLI